MKQKIKTNDIILESELFSKTISNTQHDDIRGITDGKAVGTYLEHKFKKILIMKYDVDLGNSSKGIDLPSVSINIDIKVTSIAQPQSSSPFTNARQKIYGLGHNLLLFVYEKNDTLDNNLKIIDCAYISKNRTADFQITQEIIRILEQKGNEDDIFAFLMERNLPLDDIQLNKIVDEIFITPPIQGYLTISNALQWRLQYGRIVSLKKNEVIGVTKIL